MADDIFEDSVDVARGPGAANPAALDASLNGPAAGTEEAREFLREQKHLTALQAKILHEEHALELSHLKWRRFNDQMKGALQILLVALGIGVIAGVGTAMWNASHADGLVVQSFSVPPSLAQSGTTGDVVAGDITDKVAGIRDFILENSLTSTKDITGDSRDEARIEIPETGISLTEFWQLLRSWLGHERHATGNVRQNADGTITLSLNVTGAPPIALSGPVRDLGKVETVAAEQIFGDVDPLNIAVYYFYHGRYADADAAAAHLVDLQKTPKERGDDYGLWGLITVLRTGDYALAEARMRLALALSPDNIVNRGALGDLYLAMGRAEESLREYEAALHFDTGCSFGRSNCADRTGEYIRSDASKHIATLQGDFAGAVGLECYLNCDMATLSISGATAAARLHDLAASKRLLAQAVAAGYDNPALQQFLTIQANYFAHAAGADWRAAKADAVAAIAAYRKYRTGQNSHRVEVIVASQLKPLLAVADANLGRFAEARRAINATSAVCYDCLRARGDIAMMEGRPDAAAFWFSNAVRQGQSIPFAYMEFGEMLLHDGKYEAAIAKFKQAHANGPHFADPLEMWGEALMQENRSDLALAKFEEANKYAPNWGRLHLEWGKALYYSGHKDEARKQFARAAALDLAAAEKVSLAAWVNRNE